MIAKYAKKEDPIGYLQGYNKPQCYEKATAVKFSFIASRPNSLVDISLSSFAIILT